MATLKIDFCTHEAAKFAVTHWHYSHVMPAGKAVYFGVWENEKFIGAVVFGRGANRHIGTPYGLGQDEICELTRVALYEHQTPVSQIVVQTIKILKRHSPNIKLIVSYADPARGHVGAIYQAMNWVYVGYSAKEKVPLLAGNAVHKRSASNKLGSFKGSEYATQPPKHKYLFVLDKKLKPTIALLAKPYPKRSEDVTNG